jgi:hypothetical protein
MTEKKIAPENDARGTDRSDPRDVVLHTIVRLMIHGDHLADQARDLNARVEAIGQDAEVLAHIHNLDWDRDVMPAYALARKQPDFLDPPNNAASTAS